MQIQAKVTKVVRETHKIEPRGAVAYDKAVEHVSFEALSGTGFEASPGFNLGFTIDKADALGHFTEGQTVTITIS